MFVTGGNEKADELAKGAMAVVRAETMQQEREESYAAVQFGKKSGQTRRVPNLVQKMLRLREAKNGTEIDEQLQARASGHKRVWQNVKTDPGP